VHTKPLDNRQSRTPFFCGHSKRFNGFEAIKPFRRREIEAHARHVGAAETEDFSRWLIAWCWHLSRAANDPVWSLMEAAERMDGQISKAQAAEIIDEASNTDKPPLSADDLAHFLGLTYAVRQHLGIRTIGSTNVKTRARKEQRKRKARLRMAARRRALGMKSHSDSFSRTRPWKDEGISRRTWYRRRQGDGAPFTRPLAKRAAAPSPVGTVLSAAIKKEHCAQICATEESKWYPRGQTPAVQRMKARLDAARGHTRYGRSDL